MRKKIFPLLCLLLLPLLAQAQLRLPGVFSDGMVLQRGKPAAVWGTADPGARVTVQFARQTVRTHAAADGSWQVALAPMEASMEPRILTVRSGRERREYRDVLVGEVWLASGQSNMEFNMGPVWRSGSTNKVDRPARGENIQEIELRKADLPQLRVLLVEKVLNTDSLPTRGWRHIDTRTLPEISAAAYFFAKNLIDSLQVPVGILETCWGGTRIESWTPLEAYREDPAFSAGLQGGSYDGEPVGRRYDHMVREMAPYTLRGMIWYQGESNLIAGNTGKYAAMQALLVRSWRAAWGEEFPFYFVQIAPYLYSQRRTDPSVSDWTTLPQFWEQQERSLDLIPQAAMVQVNDLVDNLSDIHPTYKWELGRRLALQALRGVYGRPDLVADGPRLLRAAADCSVVTLEFDQPLATADGKAPRHFTLAQAGGGFQPISEVKIEGNKVLISNSRVRTPVEVRYGWDEAAVTNLCNPQGLPARQFRVRLSFEKK
ncbi:MAG: hypothetical protein IJ603_01190 [Bacteroidales bacterium]|nr:hypothetical protein [Bacteroidales bacterium]